MYFKKQFKYSTKLSYLIFTFARKTKITDADANRINEPDAAQRRICAA